MKISLLQLKTVSIKIIKKYIYAHHLFESGTNKPKDGLLYLLKKSSLCLLIRVIQKFHIYIDFIHYDIEKLQLEHFC